jgi:hypothetical protein
MKKQLRNFGFMLVLLVTTATITAQTNILIDSSVDELFLYDGIEGDVLTNTNGTGWSGAWSQTSGTGITNEVSSLAYPTGSGTAVHGTAMNITGTNVIKRSFTDTYEMTGSKFYLSYLVEKSGSSTFSIRGYSGGNARYGMEITAGGSIRARASQNYGALATGVIDDNTTYLVVLHKNGNASSIAIFKEGDVIPTDPANANWIATHTGATGVDLDRFDFAFAGTGTYKVDEIRLGSTFTSVTKSDAKTYLGIAEPEIVSLTVKKTSDLPTIDGVVDPIWGEVEANAISERADGVDASDYTATFKALWSGNDTANDSIYFLIEFTDDKFVSDYLSTSDGSGGIMALDRGQDDGFDVMFNPGLAGLPAAGYGSPYRAGIVTTEADPEGTLWFTLNQDSSNSLTDNTHKAHTVNGTKYVFEFAMGLWDFEVNIATVAGYQFGVDIRYNDDDANIPHPGREPSTKRDGQYSWALYSEGNTGAWSNNAGLGDATLSNEEVSAPLSVNDIEDIKNLNIYPNPAKDHFVIQTADLNLENARVEVLSLSGQTILVQQITTTKSTVEVNISSLTSGLYLVRLISNDSNFVAKLIVE